MTLLEQLLNAGLPALDAEPGQTPHFSRVLSLEEEQIRDTIINPAIQRQKSARGVATAIPNWASWSPEQFQNWCDANLMTDLEIDGTTLSAKLKANIKANNAFTRNAGKMLIVIRDHIRIIE